MLLEFRRKISQYQETMYMVFILLMVALTSAGFNSEDKLYKIVFIFAALFLFLKLIVTDYSIKEIMWMAAIVLLLGINFLRNGERTLLLTVLGILGAKNVNTNKVFLYALWIKVVLTIGTISLAAAGIIENEMVTLPKGDVHIDLYCFGYLQPNIAYANLFSIVVLAILAYRDKLKWYIYVGFSLLMIGAYKILVCRTGLLVWGVLCVMFLIYHILKRSKNGQIMKGYLASLCLAPVMLAVLSFVLPLWGANNEAIGRLLTYFLTGRMRIIHEYLKDVGILVLGHIPRQDFDNSYFHIWYNYGSILFLIFMFVFILSMWYCIRKEKNYEVMILGVMSLYAFMEKFPLSIAWNLSLLLLVGNIFGEEAALHTNGNSLKWEEKKEDMQ